MKRKTPDDLCEKPSGVAWMRCKYIDYHRYKPYKEKYLLCSVEHNSKIAYTFGRVAFGANQFGWDKN